MPKIKSFVLFIFVFIFFTNSYDVVKAETVITDGYLYHSTIWDISGSPYIVEDPVFIPRGTYLTVKPGVRIVASSTIGYSDVINAEGDLNLLGENGNQISLEGDSGINSSFGNVNIKYSDIKLTRGVSVYNGSAHISSTTISGATVGLSIRSSNVKISNSKISNNDKGIWIKPSKSEMAFPVYENGDSIYGRGGIGNIFAFDVETPSSVDISGTSILDNDSNSILNEDTSIAKASYNWWGDSSGPDLVGQNKISGLVNYMPWLEEDPLTKKKQVCCSNILFIPGLQATRLYTNSSSRFGTSTNQLWEPNRRADVEKLYLDQTGSSIDGNVFSGSPISKAFGLKDIYGEFMKYLDSVKNEGSINNWQSFGYDWRKSIDEVVDDLEKKESSNESLISSLEKLAQSSKTGKVTIIAHSNGGLVTKYLIKRLEELNKSNLVDSVISVAVPYLGTPQAILGLLHGDNQSIAGGLILNKNTSRNLGVNMLSAYSLLPSFSFFSNIFTPTITFASTTVKGVNDGSYPKEIKSFGDQKSFVVDSANVRKDPLSNTNLPIEGNATLLLASEFIRGILDPFYWPSSIAKWAIVGRGDKTATGVNYFEKRKCFLGICKNVTTYKPVITDEGDGTVLAKSASYNSGTSITLDLKEISGQEERTVNHSNILGASSTIGAIDAIIKSRSDDSRITEKLSGIKGVTLGSSTQSQEPVTLVLATHSPVDLHVYDDNGKHVGVSEKPDGIGDIEDGLYTYYEENIPGSRFERIHDGFGGYDNYIYLPDNDGSKYNVKINGNGFGEFTFDISRMRNDQVLDTTVYPSMPVNPLTVATTTVYSRPNETAIVPKLSNNSPKLAVDYDGDGRSDLVASSSTKVGTSVHFDSIRSVIKSIIGSDKKGQSIIKKIDKMEELFKKGKLEAVEDASEKLEEYIGHKKLKGISSADKEKLIEMVELYVSQFVQ